MVLLRASMFLRRAARSVGDAIELHPFKMNSVIGAIVYGAGEGMAQLSAPKDERTTERLPAITMLGVVQVGALMTIWYNTLERMCGTSSSTRTVLHKICFDQVLWSSQNDGMFLAVCGILEKPDLPSALHETKRGFLTTWINDCAVWPLTNFLGFAVVPTKFLPAYMAFNQFLWQVFLSFITLPVGGAEEAHSASQKAATTGEIASPSRRAEVQPNGGDAISDSSVPLQPAAARANAREDTLRALYLELITPLAEGDKDEDWRGERAQAIRNASIGLTILSFSLATRVLIFRI